MKAKHTRGPWIAVGHWVEHPNDRVADICTCDPRAIGQDHLGRTDAEICANARLIAAAPELLADLKDLLDLAEHHGLQSYALENARASIAKAVGVAPVGDPQKALTMAAFDELERLERREKKDRADAVRMAAKGQL